MSVSEWKGSVKIGFSSPFYRIIENHYTICFLLTHTHTINIFVEHGKMGWFDAAKAKTSIYLSICTSHRNSSDLFISRFVSLDFKVLFDVRKGLTVLYYVYYGHSVLYVGSFAADGLHSTRSKGKKQPLVIS